MRFAVTACFMLMIVSACGGTDPASDSTSWTSRQPAQTPAVKDTGKTYFDIKTGKTNPPEVIAFARGLTGTPYKYGSVDPAQGFDCSGFITYVFNHFGITVPRSSADFTRAGREIDLKNAKPGDLVLFTGTDSTIKTVGHMGILVSSPKEGLAFIHSTSGKANGVTETPLNPYYMGRYVKTIRIFPKNDLN